MDFAFAFEYLLFMNRFFTINALIRVIFSGSIVIDQLATYLEGSLWDVNLWYAISKTTVEGTRLPGFNSGLNVTEPGLFKRTLREATQFQLTCMMSTTMAKPSGQQARALLNAYLTRLSTHPLQTKMLTSGQLFPGKL